MILLLSLGDAQVRYQEQGIVYIQKGFHHPLATERWRLVRDTEHTERTVLMENREVPILHELPSLRQRQFT